jgi:hypothetical protein
LQNIFSYHVDSFTNGWFGPSFKASMEYPKLCQSMTSFVCRRKQVREAIASTGIEGGFCSCQGQYYVDMYANPVQRTWTKSHFDGFVLYARHFQRQITWNNTFNGP